MFSEHKKLASDYILAPTIMSTDSSSMSQEAIEEMDKLSDSFKTIEISLISQMNEYEGNSTIQSELGAAIKKVTNASNQAKDIIVAEYNTLSTLTKESEFESKVLEWFTDITVKSIAVATKTANFIAEAVNDFTDGAANNDDSEVFAGTLATKLDIALATAITRISDICYDAERLADKLLSWLS